MLSLIVSYTSVPLIWMIAGKSSIAKICKIHFRKILFVCNNYDKSYHDLLNLSNDVSIHQRHLRFLAIEVYKSYMNINPEFMWEFLNKNPAHYNSWKRDVVYGPLARPSCYLINSLAFRGSLLRNSLPSNVKQSHNWRIQIEVKNLRNIRCTYVVVCCWN